MDDEELPRLELKDDDYMPSTMVYYAWKIRMRIYLKFYGLLDFILMDFNDVLIKNKCERPKVMYNIEDKTRYIEEQTADKIKKLTEDEKNKYNNMNNEEISNYKSKLAKFISKDFNRKIKYQREYEIKLNQLQHKKSMVLMSIINSLSDNLIIVYCKCNRRLDDVEDDPFSLWNRIRDGMYNSNILQAQEFELKQEWDNLKLKKRESVESFGNRIEFIVNKFKAIGVTKNETSVCQKFLQCCKIRPDLKLTCMILQFHLNDDSRFSSLIQKLSVMTNDHEIFRDNMNDGQFRNGNKRMRYTY